MSVPDDDWNTQRQIIIGFAALAVLVLGLGGWSVAVRISGAIVSSGMIQVEGFRQVVQHPTGGVVEEIHVADGTVVAAGDVLVRLDGSAQSSELAIIEGQLFDIVAERGRLIAERDGLTEPQFDPELLALNTRPDIAGLLDGQLRLFEARRRTREREAGQLNERKGQFSSQIEGAEAQIHALQRQNELITQELADQQSLLDRGLAQAGRVLSLQREQARLQGSMGELSSTIAQIRGRITEIGIEVLKLETTLRESATTSLRDLQFHEMELRERRLSSTQTLARLMVRAPVSGIVYGNNVHAVRGVVRGAEPLMYIVPQDAPLVISSRIEAFHVDQVHIGQAAVLRFPAFDQRSTPELLGTVSKVSADAYLDEATQQTFYLVEILPETNDLAKLGALQLLPGMPVETFIKTGDRTPLSYLLKPLTDYFNKAFREA